MTKDEIQGMAACIDCGGHDISYMPENDHEVSACCMECGAEWIEKDKP